MGEAYRLKVARERSEAEGRRLEREENVDFLLRFSTEMHKEATEAGEPLASESDEDPKTPLRAAAEALEAAARSIEQRKAAV